jgi:peptide/nickel transport system substrate-binding protein
MKRDYQHPHISQLKQELAEHKIDRREFLRLSTLLGLSATAAYTFADTIAHPTYAQTTAATAMPKGGTIKLHNRLDKLVHPHTYGSAAASNVGRQVLEYLTETGTDNVTRPFLAEEWSASPDLRSWTLHLRKDVKWRKGRQFTADDVIWNFKTAFDPATGSSTLGLMKGYMLTEEEKDGKKQVRLWDANAIERVDAFTIRLNLKVPQFAIPEHLYNYTFTMIDPEEGGKFEPGANGTGAFELVEFEPRARAIYRPVKNYWGEGPYLERFEFVDLGDDPSQQVAAFASKQVDGMQEGQTTQYEALKRMAHLQEYTAQTAIPILIRGKCDLKPFDDPRVRLAMRLATDVAKTTELTRRNLGYVGEHHHVSPINPDYAKLRPMQRDPTRAKTLLAEAGYPNGLDIEYPLQCPRDIEYLPDAAQAVVEQWQEAGIRVKIEPLPGAQFWENWNKAPFTCTRWVHRPLGIMALTLAYRTGVAWNESDYSNKKFDDLLLKAESVLDLEQRRTYMKELEIILQEDGPIVQPTWVTNFTFMDKRVRGFTLHPTSFIFANRLALQA